MRFDLIWDVLLALLLPVATNPSLTISNGSALTPTILMRTSVPSLICVVASVDTKASPLTALYSKSSGINCSKVSWIGKSPTAKSRSGIY